MVCRHRSTGRVHFEMLDLDQTVAYQCDVAKLVLKKPPGREKSFFLVGQERFFLSFMELAEAREFQRARVP